jgi:hypothetical protein
MSIDVAGRGPETGADLASRAAVLASPGDDRAGAQ